MAHLHEEGVWVKQYPEGDPKALEVPDISALDMFERTVSRRPQAPAIHYFDSTITYGELDSLTDSMAAGLKDLGVNKGDRVILQLQNIPQFLIALYACWKLTATVVLLNPMYKEREIEFYCNDSGAKVLVTMEDCYPEVERLIGMVPFKWLITTSELDFFPSDSPVPDVLKKSKKKKIRGCIDLVSFLKKYEGTSYTKCKPTPKDIAYFTYTSGTTGPPKGAMNSHGNVVYGSTMVKIAYDLHEQDKILGIGPFIHLTGTVTYLGPASLVGIPVIICFRYDAGEILHLAEKWQATMTNAAQTAFLSLLDHPDFKKREISSLKTVASGGAPVAEGFVKRYEQATGVYIHNTWGLTECTAPGTFTPLPLRSPVDKETNALSVGFPVPGTDTKIVDTETGADLPPGKEGEIVLKSPGVIVGYWNKPEETANAIKDGWLYTGDIGKMDENGWFYVIDRKKDLIVCSGYKVWPREVEDVLYINPAVKGACVVGVPDDYRGENVKAFVALNQDYEGKVTPEELIQFCKARMAAYKYPRICEIVPEIPKTLSGKMLRRQLREEELKKKADN